MQAKRYIQFLAKSAAFREVILKAHRSGKSQASIARKFSISRQRVNQIVRHKARKARAMVKDKIFTKMIPPAKNFRCKDCGKPATEYDHRDYDRPLAIDAVCMKCNRKRGRGRNAY